MEIERIRNVLVQNKEVSAQECYFEDKILYLIEGKLQVKTAQFMSKHLMKCQSCHKKSLLMKKVLNDFNLLVPLRKTPPIAEKNCELLISKIVSGIYFENKLEDVLGSKMGQYFKKIKFFLKNQENLYYTFSVFFLSLILTLILKK